MKFTYLLLEHYKRFSLNNIKRFEYFPKEKVQLILGTNGSGKSSLLKELTPVPPQMKNDYLPGGKKEIHITHHGKEYVLTSEYEKTTRHSFKLDNEELNPSGTRQIQLSLVDQHFNLTQDLHDILTGNKTFVNMSVAERKKWFTRISSVDYTYAITIFNLLRDRHRDVLGGIKVLNSKIAQEESKMLSEDERERLVEKIDHIQSFIETTLKLTNRVIVKPKEDIEEELKQLVIKLSTLFDALPEVKTYTFDDLNNMYNKFVIEYQYVSKDLNKKTEELEILTEKDNTNLTFNDKNSLLTVIEELALKINSSLKKLTVTPQVGTIEEAIKAFYTIYDSLNKNISLLPEDPDNLLNKETYTLNKERLEKLLKEVKIIKDNLDKLIVIEKELSHKLACDSIQCPECEHNWKPGYSESKHNKIKEKIALHVTGLENKEKEIKELEEFMVRYADKINSLESIKQIMISWPVLNFIWEYLFNDLTTNPNISQDKLFKIKEEVSIWESIKGLIEKLKKYKEELSIVEKTDSLDREKIKQEINKLENEVSGLSKKLLSIKREMDLLSNNIKLYKKIELLSTQLESKLKSRKYHLNDEIARLRNEHYNNIISTCKMELVEYEKRLRDADNHKSFIDSTKKEIDELSKKERVLKLLVKKMSPTEGLIAKGILSFMYSFMDDMADIINQIWSYDLTVLPCKVSEDSKVDLDYRFPVVVNDTNTVPDISKTSGGMQEVINLAFKITSMLYLGIEDYPLYLDEFGANMDPTHIVQAYNIIDTLTNSSFEQIFMVSHFENCYGRFNNADVVVLSNDNLSLPNDVDYNTVVKIK